ncbi:MAG: UDP-N-acetylmuramoyl-L-alanyl-D-glutamate--2,6-diaminopimelate ligase [Bdellovibrionaceae bacterium]|nr:UDP-N-acetylmuramoyl-L-alanyl-D-glutamate--2,6-diaminopimelate ligase [Pseudobdellovibrionaceae bacterium]NUM59546.1 UDP-N-acetylmuramoyl-L-alanyl-D-glutamate--2,6-diaminopimelate ligase [Pseudobdellovibrionaceae bacterium]
MKVNEAFSLFPTINCRAVLNKNSEKWNQELMQVSSSTHNIIPGTLFCAYQGASRDGHEFISEAILKGALALIVENEDKLPKEISLPCLIVTDGRAAFETLAKYFYNGRDQQMYMIGVTGTNGKTSITYLVEHLLSDKQTTFGVMGTVNHRINAKVWDSQLTTPDSWTLYQRLDEFYKLGATGAVLEVSSHALDQKRVHSLNFDVAIFTNLTRDHLDYHKTMTSYFKAKEIFFKSLMLKSVKLKKMAIINGDDNYGRKLKVADGVEKIYFGKSKFNNWRFKVLEKNFNFQKVKIYFGEMEWIFELPLIGEHNIYNFMPVLIIGFKNNYSLPLLQKKVSEFKGIPGRLQKVFLSRARRNIFIDYAHSPDALLNILLAVKKIRSELKNKKIKIFTLFGCGGDRDKGKRPLMAKVAEKHSDVVVVTSDNPRTESPGAIIEDIMKGFKSKKRVHKEENRSEAIKWIIANSAQEDVILLCGKGHENYQIIGSEKKYFSDYDEVVRNFE